MKAMTPIAMATAGLVLLLTQAATGAANETPPGKAPLQMVPLEAPASVICKADATQPDANLRLKLLAPASKINFHELVSEYGMRIGAQKLTIAKQGAGFTIKTDRATFPLRRNGAMAYATVSIPLPDGREYPLAFPYGYRSGPSAMLAYRSASAQEGLVAGQSLMIYDANTDGRYTLADDAFRIGPDDQPVTLFAPLTKYLSTGQGVLEITSIAEDGSSIQYTPYPGPTGKLAVGSSFSDLKLYAALGSQHAQTNVVTTVLPNASAGNTVPPGRYELMYGALYSAKQNKLVALIVPGKPAGADVQAGQTASLQVGGPVSLEFAIAKGPNGRIDINPTSFRLRGRAGEEYTAFAWSTPTPPAISLVKGNVTKPIGKMEFS